MNEKWRSEPWVTSRHEADAPFYGKVRMLDGTLVATCWPATWPTSGLVDEAAVADGIAELLNEHGLPAVRLNERLRAAWEKQ